ncbi:MAG: HU family DNA-binding protein [Firmicutes bacterium]|uniref:HU family DNA-binding protein n=1 Tax=Candidatus Onthovivens merdipullorum TaxID=2840889 RepID=A0A9D9DIJ5_9BACL|nr:HU family DNA-binding protein [Candidatus Onthovivens merdipullorum]
MNKTDLVVAVAEEVGMTKKDAEKAVDVFLSKVQKALENGESVKLSGFGVFQIKVKKERIGTSPLNGEKITIPETRTVGFKPSKLLKETVK